MCVQVKIGKTEKEKIDCRTNYSRTTSEYLIFLAHVLKSRIFTSICIKIVNFNKLFEGMITTFSMAPLCWLSSFCSSRATLNLLSVLGFRARSTSMGAVLSGSGRKHRRETQDEKRMRSVYLFPWLSPWKVTSSCLLPFWESTTPLKVACSTWLTRSCSGNLSLLLLLWI